jgi:DNA-binding response OmpR family regulator
MSSQPQRILVAEDNPVMGNVLRFNLERAGFSVELIPHGGKALDRFQAETFDLVIADYQMPGLNGEQLCRAIRQGQWNANVPALLITAKRFELDAETLAAELGLAHILSKPFSPREVVEVARAAVKSRQVRPPTTCA